MPCISELGRSVNAGMPIFRRFLQGNLIFKFASLKQTNGKRTYGLQHFATNLTHRRRPEPSTLRRRCATNEVR